MAGVRRRETGAGTRYGVRYRDLDGAQHRRTFTKGLADRFATTVEADKLRGTYIDPDAGRVTFKAFANQWLDAQTFNPSTREMVELRLRVHAFPALGDKQLRQVKPSTIQAWLRTLDEFAPSYRRVIFANVSSVFAAAVDDEAVLKTLAGHRQSDRPRSTITGSCRGLPTRYTPYVPPCPSGIASS